MQPIKHLTLFFAVICCSVVQAVEPKETDNQAELEAFVDGWVHENMNPQEVAGVMVSIVQNGNILLEKGYGYADIEKHTSVDPVHSLFRVGSISKLFTYTAAMQLVETGRLDLHADINTYLTDMKIAEEYGKPITATHLMTHRAGFEDTVLGIDFIGGDVPVPSPTEYLTRYVEKRVAPPGLRTSYSNYGVSLLGHVVEEIAHTPYSDYIEQHILQPLGIEHSSFREPGRGTAMPNRLVPFVAKGYAYRDGKLIEIPSEHIYPAAAPAGALYTSAHDMALFMNMYLNAGSALGDDGNSVRLLAPETVLEMQTRNYADRMGGADIAHGFFNSTIKGYNAYSHGGAMAGFLSHLVLVPEKKLGIFISVNSADHAPAQFPAAVIGYMLPEQNTVYGSYKAHGDAALSDFTGLYLTDRRPYSTLAKLMALGVGETTVTAEKSDTLGLGGRQWQQIAPLQFAANDNPDDVIVFQRGENDKIVRYHDTRGMAHDRIGYLQSTNFFYAGMILAGIGSCALLVYSCFNRQRFDANKVVHVVPAIVVLVFLGLFYAGTQEVLSLGPFILYQWPPLALTMAVICSYALTFLAVPMAAVSVRTLLSTDYGLLNKTISVIYFSLICWLLAGMWVWNFL
ncbi:serine hydrolase domain-containing protein [Kordiimonas pumila]|uniref:Serine hydrolase domain-containing protein n=1 Tax=Kordiimonas pumila TaxID=2161677 RepID=A0ABV7D1H2_9PROT|nr:serine hydrolase domain-containing protein [Kordiimonas pumila]